MLIQYFFTNPFVTLTSFLIGALVALIYQVIKFYSNVQKYPPGPLPLPWIGNILAFRKKGKRLPHQVITSFEKAYGPIFTFWFGNDPQVVILDPKLVKEAMSKMEFAGRPSFGEMEEIFLKKGSIDIFISDSTREWEVLRKMSHTAVRKFAVSERLPIIVDSVVKAFLDEIKVHNGEKAFDPVNYLKFLMISLLATTAFGKPFKMSDPDYKFIVRTMDVQNEFGNKIILVSFVPLLKYYWRKEFKCVVDTNMQLIEYAEKQLKEHMKSFDETKIRDFTDATIQAVKEAQVENSTDLKYLTQDNIVNSLLDLFTAGSETTKITLSWTLLLLATYPKMQEKIREEVQAALGTEDILTLDHRPQCNLLQAFLYETMRFRPLAPLGIPHKAILDVELAGHKIIKESSILFSLESCLMDKDIWGDPESFRPERFLKEDGTFNAKPNAFFLPFGSGRRVCLGEKLALANSFLIIGGILHQTKGQMLVHPNGPGGVDLSPSPEDDQFIRPRPHKLVFSKV